MTTPATDQQQPPTPNSGEDLWLAIIRDMEERRQFGLKKYGQPVRAHNGRDPLVDLFQELLDALVYCKQLIVERDAQLAMMGNPEAMKRRTRSEVMAERNSMSGCCNRYADRMSCDCLSEAIDDTGE